MASTSALIPPGPLAPVSVSSSAMTPPPQMSVAVTLSQPSPTLMQNSHLNASVATSRASSPLDPVRADSPADGGVAGSNPPTKRNAFVHKLFAMLSDPALNHLIWWTECEEQNVFALHPGEEFATALTNYFKHGNVASFVRQLHMYGFHKVSDPNNSSSNTSPSSCGDLTAVSAPSKLPVWEFKHSSGKFKKDDESSLKYIKRRSSSNSSRHSFTTNAASATTGPTSVPLHASSEDLVRLHSGSLPQFQHHHYQHQLVRMAAGSSPMQQPQPQPHYAAGPYPYPYIQSPYMLGGPQPQMYTVAGHPMHSSTPTPYQQQQQQQQYAAVGPHVQASMVPQQIVAPVPQAPFVPQHQHQMAPVPPQIQQPQVEIVAKPATPLSQTSHPDAERSRTPQLAQSASQTQYQPQYYAPNLQFRKIWETSSTEHSKTLSRPRIPSLLLDPLIPAANASSLPRSIQNTYTSPVMQHSEAPRSIASQLKSNASSISNVTPIADLIRPSLAGMQTRTSTTSSPTPLAKRSHDESVSSTNSSIFLMRSTSSITSTSSSFAFGNTVSPKPFAGIPSQVPCRNTSFGAGSFPLLNIKSGSIAIGPTDVPEQPKVQSVAAVAAIRASSPIIRSESSNGVVTPRVVPKCIGFRSQTSSPLSQCHSSTINEALEPPTVKKMSVTSMLNDRSDKRRKVE